MLRAHNDYNRRVHDYVEGEALAGRGALVGWTKDYRLTEYPDGHEQRPIPALKTYFMSPFVDEDSVKGIVEKVLESRRAVAVVGGG